MRSVTAILLTTLLATVGFAGCFGGDEPLAAAFAATPVDEQKSKYKFDAGASTGEGLTFTWDFGDRTTPATGKLVEHTYEYLNGKYAVTLTLTDASKKTTSLTQRVQVGSGANNAPFLYAQADKRLVTPGESVTFDATQSYDPDGDPLYFAWDFNSMLPDDELNKMENLGTQQYGRYARGPPPSGSADNSTGGEGGPTPSGHDWTQEYKEAVKRHLKRAGVTTFDGDHSGAPPEPRNEGFDGRVNDTSPLQVYSFPSPATYFVHIRVFDVKGDGAQGFLRIRVADTVPNATETYVNVANAKFAPKPLGAGANGAGGVESYHFYGFNQKYPGNVTVTVTFVEDPAPGPVTERMSAWSCTRAAGSVTADCAGQKKGAGPGPSPLTFSYDVRADLAGDAGAWQLLVMNEDNVQTSATIKLVVINDLNPWAKQESGLEVGHH